MIGIGRGLIMSASGQRTSTLDVAEAVVLLLKKVRIDATVY